MFTFLLGIAWQSISLISEPPMNPNQVPQLPKLEFTDGTFALDPEMAGFN